MKVKFTMQRRIFNRDDLIALFKAIVESGFPPGGYTIAVRPYDDVPAGETKEYCYNGGNSAMCGAMTSTEIEQ